MVPILNLLDSSIKDRHEGFVADYCTFCCELRVFILYSTQWHTSFAGIDSHEKTDYLAQCQTCGFWHATELERYTEPCGDAPHQLSDLIDATFPGIREKYSKELAFEQRIRKRTVGPGEIHNRICEAVRKVDAHLFAIRRHKWTFDVRLFVTSISAVGIGMCTFLIGHNVLKIDLPNSRAAGWLAAFLAPLPVWFILRYLRTQEIRANVERFLPLVALSLVCVRPSQRELQDALVLLCKNGCSLAGEIDADDILRAFKRQGFGG